MDEDRVKTNGGDDRHAKEKVIAAIAVVVLLAAAAVWRCGVEPAMARRNYERALADWKAAGLPDPLKSPVPEPVVSKEKNLFEVEPFDGLGLRDGPGLVPPAAIIAKWNRIGIPVFSAGRFDFDPAIHFSGKIVRAPSILVPPASGETAAHAVVALLEREYPSLKDVAAIVAAHPETAFPATTYPAGSGGRPTLAIRPVWSNRTVLAAYAGCRILEGDGGPAATLVPVLIRHDRFLAERDGATAFDLIVVSVESRAWVPRLIRLGLAKGVWSDAELESIGAAATAATTAPALFRTIPAEAGCILGLLDSLRAGDPVMTKAWVDEHGVATWLKSNATHAWNGSADTLDTLREIAAAYAPASGWDDRALARIYNGRVVRDDRSFATAEASSFVRLASQTMLGDTMMSCASLGCALERYRLRHGAYPDKLGALVPDFAKAIPKAPWGGPGPVYARTPAGGYTLKWPDADKTGGMGALWVTRTHPGPWTVLGFEVKMPESVRLFDSVSFGSTTPAWKDIEWEMPPPEKK